MSPSSSPPRVFSVINPFPLVLPFRSTWADAPVDLAAPLNSGGWDEAGSLRFSRGWALAKNDAHFLYLALDVTADTGNDPGTEDYFWLTFDVNRDRAITANQDVNFATPPGQPENLRKQFYLGPNRWTGLQDTSALVRTEFGPSPNSAASHRIWKFRIPLSEISVNLAWPLGTPHTFLGFRVRSRAPAFLEEVPSGFGGNFSALRQLVLSRKPSIAPGLLGPVIGSVGLIPTTTIGPSGRATTDPGYFIHAQNAAFGGTLNLIGNRARLADLWSRGARKYRIEMAPPGGGYADLISSWNNYRWNPAQGRYVLATFAPTAAGVYTLPNPAHDYSIDDLLIQFPTGAFAPGLHRFRVRFFENDATTAVSAPNQIVSLFIDNHLPQAVIESVQHGGSEISACAIQNLGAAPDGIRFRITAHDPEGNLLAVSLRATYGENQAQSIFGEGYEPAKEDWQGFTNRLVPPRGMWRPPVTCAYSFVLTATARTTNGYGYIGRTTAHRNVTLIL
jgi:hypothetical protein